MKSRHASLLLLVIMISSLLTGCTLSNEEKAIKTEVENIAKPYIESFVQDNYKEWEINRVGCMIGNKEEFSLYASNFVKAVITNENYEEAIEIVYNTKNGETFVKNENLNYKEEIAQYLGIPNEGIVDITFEYIPLQEYDLFTVGGNNFYKIGETDTSKYKINIVANCEKKNTVDDIRLYIRSLTETENINYEIMVVQGYKENTLRDTQYYMKKYDNCSLPSVSERCTVTIFRNKDSVKTENTVEFKKIAVDGGYIIYNGTDLELQVKQKDNRLGIEESINSTMDTEVTINRKDKSKGNIQIGIFSTTNNHVVIEDSDGIKRVNELHTWSNRLFTTEDLKTKTYEKIINNKETITISLINK